MISKLQIAIAIALFVAGFTACSLLGLKESASYKIQIERLGLVIEAINKSRFICQLCEVTMTWDGNERRGEDRIIEFMKEFKSVIEDRLDRSHTENRQTWADHLDREHRNIEEKQQHQDTKLESHEKSIQKANTLFGVVSWASGAAWTGLLAWLGLTNK